MNSNPLYTKQVLYLVDVPVTCFPPSSCAHCGEKDTSTLNVGHKNITVYTIKGKQTFNVLAKEKCTRILINILFCTAGRFDLNSALMYCSSCENTTEATDEDYVYSGWWPAKPGKDDGEIMESANVFYDEALLDLWYEMQNNTPGTSQEMFLKFLSEKSDQNKRVIKFYCIVLLL